MSKWLMVALVVVLPMQTVEYRILPTSGMFPFAGRTREVIDIWMEIPVQSPTARVAPRDSASAVRTMRAVAVRESTAAVTEVRWFRESPEGLSLAFASGEYSRDGCSWNGEDCEGRGWKLTMWSSYWYRQE